MGSRTQKDHFKELNRRAQYLSNQLGNPNLQEKTAQYVRGERAALNWAMETIISLQTERQVLQRRVAFQRATYRRFYGLVKAKLEQAKAGEGRQCAAERPR
jgi:hypothetical protein